MFNPRLSQRYAKSLLDLSGEMKKLDEVRNDMIFLDKIIKGSREFKVMLSSPVIKSDKKYKIISAVTKDQLSEITNTFIKLLCSKNRESNFPEIVHSFLEQYNGLKGLHSATLTTAAPISAELAESFKKKIKDASTFEHLDLETKVDESLIGGFVLEVEGKLVDASILRDLNDVKKQFANNDYIHKLR